MSEEPTLPVNKTVASHYRMMQELPLAPPADAPLPQEACDYREFRESLPPDAREMLDSMVVMEEPPDEGLAPRWCLCEAPEGEFSRVRLFKTAEDLVRYMGKLEGQEVSAWVFYGQALRFTKAHPICGRRLLLLPGEKEAVGIPAIPNEPLLTMSAQQIPDDVAFQENGWLGQPELAESSGDTAGEFLHGNQDVRKQRESRKKKKDGDDDDEQEQHAEP
jgi:hypothetical protein